MPAIRLPRQLAATGSSSPRPLPGKSQRLRAPAGVGLLDPVVGEVGQERAARARAQVLLVLLAEQVDRDRQRRALDRDAVEVVQRRVDRQRHQPPPRGVHQAHVDEHRALGRLAALLGPVQVRPGRERHVVAGPRRLGDVVDELVPGVLEHHRPPDRLRELREDLRHPAALQDQVGEALVDLLAAAQQLELAVEHRGVHRLGDLDEAHGPPERHERHAGRRARARPPPRGSARARWSRARPRPPPRPARAPTRSTPAGPRPWSRAPSPVVSTSSPPLSRSSGSGISITCAQRSSRPSSSWPVTTSGRPRRTTGSSRTSASVSIRTVTHCHARRAAVSIATPRRQTGGSRWPDWRGPAAFRPVLCRPVFTERQ